MTDDPKDNIPHFPTFVRMPEPFAKAMRDARSMLSREYRLEGHKAVPCEFGVSFYERQRIIKATGNDPHRVAFDDLGSGLTISTVFLGIDHSHFREGPPMLFETMIFGGGDMLDIDCRSCSTWEEAEQQHVEMMAYAKARANG